MFYFYEYYCTISLSSHCQPTLIIWTLLVHKNYPVYSNWILLNLYGEIFTFTLLHFLELYEAKIVSFLCVGANNHTATVDFIFCRVDSESHVLPEKIIILCWHISIKNILMSKTCFLVTEFLKVFNEYFHSIFLD